jgi:hypothetical protein
MIYTLFLWTVVGTAIEPANAGKTYFDWRPLSTIESWSREEDDSENMMLEKCMYVAKQLNLKSDRYRCVRTK